MPPHPTLAPGDYRYTVEDSAHTEYQLHVPTDFHPDWLTPLVIVLPEGQAERRTTRRPSEWRNLADRVGFLTASLETGSGETLPALIKDITSRVTLDTARIYLVGAPQRATHISTACDQLAAASFAGERTKNLPALPNVALADTEAKQDCVSLWRFFERHPRFSGQPILSRLVVTCTGLRNDQGQVMVSLFNQATGFPDNKDRAFRSANATVADHTATVTFSDLPPGDYACVFIHDENGNGVFDTSFGYPLEGFGTSNNPRVRFGPPRFDDARFYLAGDAPERHITLRTNYL
jgi:uncharacterized protein (DUF2141 family)